MRVSRPAIVIGAALITLGSVGLISQLFAPSGAGLLVLFAGSRRSGHPEAPARPATDRAM